MAVAGGCGVACGVAWLVLAYAGPSHLNQDSAMMNHEVPRFKLSSSTLFMLNPYPAQFDAIRQNGLCTPFGRRRAWGRSSVEWGIPMLSGEIHARQTQAILSAEWLVIT
ncbi:hypothetical protein DFH08DRAFT_1043545 [Mycena albidolilacea]|uniref:Uncharacterized protein n=1 Tax=Mycena albidolilacea TaxID=1033008 RepID=A0AAD6ZN31_9AGAR|nr:hypothetical protein DFH08DRAFT_814949 [Mycena albidolilacea]KAJ7358479.1 hypothetical protein DFH08DRAFT_1043545 [Mycena albidolilacea]